MMSGGFVRFKVRFKVRSKQTPRKGGLVENYLD